MTNTQSGLKLSSHYYTELLPRSIFLLIHYNIKLCLDIHQTLPSLLTVTATPQHPASSDQTRDHTDTATTVLLVCVPIIGILLITTVTATVAAVVILVKYKPST